jgi:hypothetical protein
VQRERASADHAIAAGLHGAGRADGAILFNTMEIGQVYVSDRLTGAPIITVAGALLRSWLITPSLFSPFMPASCKVLIRKTKV